ncbi:hypothetical protein ACQRUO_36485, partial [Kitasatospora sp. LaBMicrA B282]
PGDDLGAAALPAAPTEPGLPVTSTTAPAPAALDPAAGWAPAGLPPTVVGQAVAVQLRGPVVLVLPMGAGLVLIGTGLALVGWRLRRG